MKKNKVIFNLKETLILIILTLIISFLFGYYISYKKYNSSNTEDKYLKKFQENYNYIIENYYDDIDKDALIDNAVNGMISSLDDEYSSYIEGTNSELFDIELNGEYKGLGITISSNENKEIIIVDVMKNSPAEKENVRVGDKIVKVNGLDSSKMNIEEISDYIESQEEKEIILELGTNEGNREVTLKREKIVIDSVHSKVYEKNNNKIGYLKIDVFALNTAEQLKKQLKQLENKKINSLIIDVRNNGGGHLSSAKEIVSCFLKSDMIAYQIEEKGNVKKYYSEGTKVKNYPIVILTNGESASGAELLTAALKDNNLAITIGEKTYGKGTVQEVVKLEQDIQYKLTTKKWLTPKGDCIDKKGILPTIEVKETEDYKENNTEENDAQLKKAIDYLNNK